MTKLAINQESTITNVHYRDANMSCCSNDAARW